jgi:hypothetical protein
VTVPSKVLHLVYDEVEGVMASVCAACQDAAGPDGSECGFCVLNSEPPDEDEDKEAHGG